MQPAGVPETVVSQPPALVEAAQWSRLSADRPLEELVAIWLSIQCGIIAGCQRALVSITDAESGLIERAWPEGRSAGDLRLSVADAIAKKQGVVASSGASSGVNAAYPLIVGGEAVGAVAIALADPARDALVIAMRQLQWGVAWLRERILADRLRRQGNEAVMAATVLDALAIALEEHAYADATRAVVTDLADRFGCERVSLGLSRRTDTRIVAISHTAHFGKRMNLVTLLANAMNEASDERRVVIYPRSDGEAAFAEAHRALAVAHGSGCVMSVPMMLDGRSFGVLTFERTADRPFSVEEAETLDILATALAPIVEDKRLNARPLPQRALDDTRAFLARFLSRDHAVTKLIAALAVLAVALFSFWYADYEIVGDAVVEGREQRAISAGFDGFLREATARPGDVVTKGQLLAALDERDLVLERVKWTAERQQHAIEYEKALSEGDRTGLRVADALQKQAEAQIALIDEQLTRARLVAPFDGVIVSGDHSQDIGSAVQRGDVLFEIAPAGEYRVMLAIPEQDIAHLEEGRTGRLAVAALPGESFDITIRRMTPVARIVDGRNVFEVEAWPKADAAGLRPGMRGAARIESGRERVIWIWTHSFFDWLRLALWRIV